MKHLKKNLLLLLIGVFMVGMTADLQAQDRTSAVDAYNKARDLAEQGNYEEAISAYNQAMANAQSLGEEGQDIVERIEKALPTVHFRYAAGVYKQVQPLNSVDKFDRIMSVFQEARSVGEEYGNEEVITKSSNIVTKMHYNKAVYLFENQNWEQSLTHLNEAISRDSNYAIAYYQKALLFKNQEGNSLEEVMAAYDKAIEVANRVGDNGTVRRASRSAASFLTTRGAELNEQQRHEQALEVLDRAVEYDNTLAEAHYRIAVAYNKLGEWNQALTAAQQALEHETGGRGDQAKIYFEIGTSYKNQDNKEAACNAFANAAYGDFSDPARHQMEVELECETDTGN